MPEILCLPRLSYEPAGVTRHGGSRRLVNTHSKKVCTNAIYKYIQRIRKEGKRVKNRKNFLYSRESVLLVQGLLTG